MNLQELGAVLRQERENKGLSLDDVVQATKISRRNIEALEQGREDELPHPVYAKGFLKNYAKLLGLNPDKLGNALTQVYSIEQEDEDVDLSAYRAGGYRPDKPATNEPGGGAVAKLGLAITILLILGGVGLAGYMVVDGRIELPYASRLIGNLHEGKALTENIAADAGARSAPASDVALDRLKERNTSETAAEQAIRLTEPVATSLSAAQAAPHLASKPEAKSDDTKPEVKSGAKIEKPADAKPAETAKASDPLKAVAAQAAREEIVPSEPAEATPAVQSAAQSVQDDKAARKVEKEKVAQVAASQAPEAAFSKSEQVLIIEASEECWVTSNVDGTKKSASYMLKPGQTLRLSYRKSLALRLGNGGGVSLNLNGKPQAAPGRSGEVVNLRYP